MKNQRERLFELIRREEVILFAGAGLSIYAGFPSGNKLREIIYNCLTTSEKEDIPEHLNLTELTEQLIRARNGSRNGLIQILNKTFAKNPTTFPYVHRKLSSIPHIKTIITTNYDSLIEESYEDECCVLITDDHIPYIDKNKVEVFKIHGDLKNPGGIIISQSDYNSFFKNNSEHSIYWSVLKERLATKSILFLGYNLEDPNVTCVFERIMEVLKENKKENFFVGINLSDLKKSHLQGKGISCIEDKAENLLEDLLQNIKENISTDLINGDVNINTFYKFSNKINVLPDIEVSPGGFSVKSVRGLKGPLQGKLNFNFKKDTDLGKEFLDFSQGKRFGKFELSSTDLENIGLTWGELKMPEIKGDFKLHFINQPKINTAVDLRFEDGYQYNNFPVKIYGSPYKIEIHTILPFIELILEIKAETLPDPICNFTYQHKQICAKVHDEIEFHEFLWRLSSQMKVTIFKNSEKVAEHLSPKAKELKENAKFYLNYFQNLEKIEKHFNIQFSNIEFNLINNQLNNTVRNIVSIIEKGFFEIKMKDRALLEFSEITSETIFNLEELNLNGNKFEYDEGQNEIYELHGIELNLGVKQIEILEPRVVNLEEMKQEKQNYALIESRIQKARINYF